MYRKKVRESTSSRMFCDQDNSRTFFGLLAFTPVTTVPTQWIVHFFFFFFDFTVPRTTCNVYSPLTRTLTALFVSCSFFASKAFPRSALVVISALFFSRQNFLTILQIIVTLYHINILQRAQCSYLKKMFYST